MTAERYYERGTCVAMSENAYASLTPVRLAGAQEVLHYKLAQPLRLGAQDPAAIAPRDLVHKCGQPFIVDEHEDV
jgi:hypothetical protein